MTKQYQYANNPATTLSGSLTSGATSISVVSASDFPTSGDFTIIIDSELMLVTGVSGTTWTVERGAESTTPAAHNNNAAVTGIVTKASFLNAHWIDARVYGAVGDDATDNTTALQAALDAAGVGGKVHLPDGTYQITDNLYIDSQCEIVGAGRGAIIKQVTVGKHGLVSRSWHSTEAVSPTGHCQIRNLGLQGPGGASGRGILLRDYYSLIENVNISGFEDGIHIQTTNDVGTSVGGTLVENQIRNVRVYTFSGYGIYVGSDDNGKLTDGFIDGAILNASTATNSINIGSAAGWQVRGVHCYGNTSSSYIRLRGAFRTIMDGVYCEAGFTTQAIELSAYQRGAILSNITVDMRNTAGEFAVSVGSSALYQNDGVTIIGLTVSQDNNAAVTAVTQTGFNTALKASRLVGLALQGTYFYQITPVSGISWSVLEPTGKAPRLVFPTYYGATADPTSNSTTLPASGGMVAIPFEVPATGLLQSVTFRHNTGSSRFLAAALYRQVGNGATAVRVALWTHASYAAATTFTVNVDSVPVQIPPGSYWLVLMNTTGSTANVGKSASATLVAACRTATVAGSDPPQTLDMSTGWSDTTDNVFAALKFRVFGESS